MAAKLRPVESWSLPTAKSVFLLVVEVSLRNSDHAGAPPCVMPRPEAGTGRMQRCGQAGEALGHGRMGTGRGRHGREGFAHWPSGE